MLFTVGCCMLGLATSNTCSVEAIYNNVHDYMKMGALIDMYVAFMVYSAL
jgi:hypothetical protein